MFLAGCATPEPGGNILPAYEPGARVDYGDHDYDILIKGGTIYDGSGGKPYVADIAVEGDRISAVYPKLKGHARVVIDARRKAVAPGFIDVVADAKGPSGLQQGVTLEMTVDPAAAACGGEEGASDLAETVRERTSRLATDLGLKERGRLMPGWHADIIVFDPKNVADVSDVIVDGAVALRNGEPTGFPIGLALSTGCASPPDGTP